MSVFLISLKSAPGGEGVLYEVMELQHLDVCTAGFVSAYEEEPWTIDRAREYLTDLFNTPRSIGFCAFENDLFVGAIICREIVGSKYNRLSIEEFFVIPIARRKGYGNALMEIVRRHVCNNGLGAITLMTERDNPAVSFYEKGGFAHVEHMAFLADQNI